MMKLKRMIIAILAALSICVQPAAAEEPQTDEPPVIETEPEGETQAHASEEPDSLQESDPEQQAAESRNPDAQEDKESDSGEPDPAEGNVPERTEEPERTSEETGQTEQHEQTTSEAASSAAASEEGSEEDNTKAIEWNETVNGESDAVQDLNETLAHASARLNHTAPSAGKGAPLLGARNEAEEVYRAQLISKGRIAQYDSILHPGQNEFLSMFFLGDQPCYCVEPNVSVVLNGDQGSIYDGRKWEELDEETKLLLKRIVFFGYGNPSVGTTKEAYAATQLLVWEVVDPESYEKINSTLHMCKAPTFEYVGCSVKRFALDAVLKKIRSMVENSDTVPSFANGYHTVHHYWVDWGETMVLEDKNDVLSWFNTESEEEHPGINVHVRDGRIYVDIDDLYYDGWDQPHGKLLTFKRDSEQWDNMLQGVLLYESGSQQKLMAAGSENPTPQYQLYIQLKSGETEVQKTDEYGNIGPITAGTAFCLGWTEDPDMQYAEDEEWREIHDAHVIQNDEDGISGSAENHGLRYPIRNPDGTIRVFQTDENGLLRIDGFLPTERTWWLKELSANEAFLLREEPVKIETKRIREESRSVFVNPLRDVTLKLSKRDEDDPEIRLDEAEIQIYEIGDDIDLSREPSIPNHDAQSEELPSLTWAELTRLCNPEPGVEFVYEGWKWTVLQVQENECVLQAVKEVTEEPEDSTQTVSSGEGSTDTEQTLLVSDTRGNAYRLWKNSTEILTAAEDESMRASSTDIAYGQMTEEGNEGCPSGHTMTRDLNAVESIAYEGPQYEDLAEQSGEIIVWNETEYRVVEKDAVSVVLSFVSEEKEYVAELNQGIRTERAYHTRVVPVTFTVTACEAMPVRLGNTTDDGKLPESSAQESTEPVKEYHVTVNRPAEVTYEALSSVLHGQKEINQHVLLNETEWKITELDLEAKTATLQDEAGTVQEITEETELPYSWEAFEEAEILLKAGDPITILDVPYLILSVNEQPITGMHAILKRVSDGKVIEVIENAGADVYDTVTFEILPTDEETVLDQTVAESRFELREDNPLIHLSEEDGTWKINAETNTAALLVETDCDGVKISTRRIIFSSTQPAGAVTGIPVFAGKTGHAYVRIMDRSDHNMPLPARHVVLYRNEALTEEVKRSLTDRYGVIDITDLEPGTYWYRDPSDGVVRSAERKTDEALTGTLQVEGFKWGRTYLAVETELPEGYEYGDNEVIHTFVMNTEAGMNTMTEVLFNRMRRIGIEVFKLDQDDEQTPLNGAWFTAEDITGLSDVPAQTDAYRLSDFPKDMKAGDTVYYWPEKPQGRTLRWTVEAVLAEEVRLRNKETGELSSVPVNGIHEGMPMLYTDLLRLLGTVQEGVSFETAEKVPFSEMRSFRVLRVHTGPVTDLFGTPVNGTVPVQAELLELNGSDEVLTVRADRDPYLSSPYMIGEYVSGGIVRRAMHEEPVFPVTLAQLCRNGKPEIGKTVAYQRRKTADMPDVQTVRNALNAGAQTMDYDGIRWNIEAEGDHVVITFGEYRCPMDEHTRSGAITYGSDALLTVTGVEERDGTITSVTVREADGTVMAVTAETDAKRMPAGTPGLLMEATPVNAGITYRGYTDKDGRTVLENLPDGVYEVSFNGTTERVKVEKGLIHLSGVKYGHTIRICETASPFGYLVGNACAVMTPQTDASIDIVTNTRTNAKIVTRTREVRTRVVSRKMGDAV